MEDKRRVPHIIQGYGETVCYNPVRANRGPQLRTGVQANAVLPGERKVLSGIEEVLHKTGLKNGMTISFHHHYRNGDVVLNEVMRYVAKAGIKNIRLAATALYPCHEPLLRHIENGVITAIDTAYITGPLAKAVSKGMLPTPMVMRTHGGRAAAIETGELHIDVAFIAAPIVDVYGNLNGVGGNSPCGAMGYPMADAAYANYVVVLSDCVQENPIYPVSIDQTQVDYVVKVAKAGDNTGIATGTTAVTEDPKKLLIAQYAADVVEASGYLKQGISFQTGAGGATLATAKFVREKMLAQGIKGSFALGGITKLLVDMSHDGLFAALLDVQSFDLAAVESLQKDKNHVEISISKYANQFTKGPVVNDLDVAIMGATEVDIDFNVNVTTNSLGVIMGGSGGHADASMGSKLTVVVTDLTRKEFPIIKQRVTTCTTPGSTVDVVVTEHGIAINPARPELKRKLVAAGLPVKTMEELKALAESLCPNPPEAKIGDKIVAVVKYRDNSVIDVVRQVLD